MLFDMLSYVGLSWISTSA
ncbi:rCG39405 [Rattus norvegicus]|uniref:RCG39405 n=1 Tax=Rattus norvegicus TaxID=10116 RepID=A6I9Y6_RAT|nr:rCG39405 [Rattus norvegicus]